MDSISKCSFSKLIKLSLFKNDIEKINHFVGRNVPKLEELNLGGSYIKDITLLSNCKFGNKKIINLLCIQITDINVLKDCSPLK